MEESKVVQCKRIVKRRFLQATIYSLVAQLAPVTIFLLFVNINLFHPITWILDTGKLVFSIYTWIYMIPLITAVSIHGIIWSKVFLSRTNYYRNRFMLILHTCSKKALLLLSYAVVGFFTAWIFVKILNWKAGMLTSEARWCLLLNGVFNGSFFFIRSRMKLRQDVEFPLIQQQRFLRIRNELYFILRQSFMKAFMPSLIYITVAIVLMPLTVTKFRFEHLTVAALMDNWRLFMYIWILASQIIGNMQFMEQLFTILLTEYQEFPVQDPSSLTLADAINADQFKIVQELGSMNLYVLGKANNYHRRKELFSLSIPGGHPYNWKAVSEATLRNITAFTQQLLASIENVQTYEKNQAQSPTALAHQQQQIRSASHMAEKILNRQMNETMGIRNMSHVFQSDEEFTNKRPNILQRLPQPEDVQQGVDRCLQAIQNKLVSLPGIHYLLAEQHYARVYFVLRQSQRIVWLVQGLATLASRSISEDDYGIVQKTLPAVIAQLLELRAVVDRVEKISMDRGKFKGHHRALRSAVRRGLYTIASSFGAYLNDLILTDSDRAALLPYVNYKEN